MELIKDIIKAAKDLLHRIHNTCFNTCDHRFVSDYSEKNDRHIIGLCRYRNRLVHSS